MVLTPAARMMLSIVQMQFIFLNTTELDIARHKVVARFGLMHMVATNLCEWLYVLVEETKHEIFHLAHSQHESSTIEPNHSIPIHVSSSMNLTETTEHSTFKRSLETSSQYQDCQRTSIMGSLGNFPSIIIHYFQFINFLFIFCSSKCITFLVSMHH